jgi:hypothetical protein
MCAPTAFMAAKYNRAGNAHWLIPAAADPSDSGEHISARRASIASKLRKCRPFALFAANLAQFRFLKLYKRCYVLASSAVPRCRDSLARAWSDNQWGDHYAYMALTHRSLRYGGFESQCNVGGGELPCHADQFRVPELFSIRRSRIIRQCA